MIGIYKITNPKGKIYIGQSVNIKKRWYSYEKLYCKQQFYLYNSLVKYGIENHKFEIIEECLLEQLNEREIYWKQYYLKQVKDNWKKVLFCDLYDEGGGPRSEQTKQKLRKPKTQEWKDKIGDANRKPKPNGFGKKPEGFGEKISKTHKGVPKPKPNNFKYKIIELKSKPIQQFTLEGKLVQEFNSIKDANIYLGKNSHSIGRACRGERKTAFGYIWQYKN